MSTPALRHFVERALGVHAPRFEDGFPGCFDWRGLCRDTPALVERAGGGSSDGADRSWSAGVQERADAVFRFAHTVALAVLCASNEDEEDPEALLDAFAEPPDDDEEDRFGDLVVDVLEPLERNLADESVLLKGAAETARELFDRVWPPIPQMLAELEAQREEGDDEDEAAQDEEWSVLLALARVAVILAVLRWMASRPADDA